MITRVRVKNFKSLADVDVTLGPLTVLVGRNGAGKSAFLDCLRFLKEGLQDLDKAISSRGGFNHICKRSVSLAEGFEIRINIEEVGASIEYFVRIASDAGRGWFVAEEGADAIDRTFQREPLFKRNDMNVEPNAPHPNHTDWADWMPLPEPQQLYLTSLRGASACRVLYYSILGIFFSNVVSNELRPPQLAQQYQVMSERGSNLASALNSIKQRGNFYRSLLVDLQHLIPGVIDINIEPLGSDYLLVRLKHTQENGREEWFDLSQESDGTIRAVALLASIYSMPDASLPASRFLAIEEPELALYPDALGLISDILRGAALRNQVLFTTQSPDLIAHFGANELRVVENENGATSIGPLAASQRQALEEQLFNAGDLLRIEGLYTTPGIVPDLANA